MRVIGLQVDLAWEDPAANRRRLEERVAAAASPGVLVVLPELWPTGFTMRADLAEEPGGASELWMQDVAESTGACVAGSVAQRVEGATRPRNVFLLVSPSGEVHRYAKIHPFSHGGEDRVYGAGDLRITVDLGGVRVTPLVCYDLRFAELFTTAAVGTDLFVVVANWPAARTAHWRTLLAARAIESQCYVLGVNRVGRGGGLEYRGDSQLVSPLGEILSSLPPETEGEVGGEVDADEVARVRAELPFLADRREEVYERLRDPPAR